MTSSSESTDGHDVAEESVADFSMLSCVFMPSMVTLMAPLGRPLMEELRGLVGVCVPGWVTISSTALRVANGRSVTCCAVRVLLTSARWPPGPFPRRRHFDGLRGLADFQLDVDGRRNAGVHSTLAPRRP